MEINYLETFIKGVYVLTPKQEKLNNEIVTPIYKKQLLYELGLPIDYDYKILLHTNKGILRGLHFNTESKNKKIVRIANGEVYYVVVDLRKDSKTRGKYYGIILNSKESKSLYIPEGFAEGYLTFSEEAKILFTSTEEMKFNHKTGIIWNDPDLNIEWFTSRVDRILISRKDRLWHRFSRVINSL